MNLSDQALQQAFATFVRERKQQLGITSEAMAGIAPLDLRTINRYLAIDVNDPSRWRPETIPDKTYHELLKAVRATHAEFAEYLAKQAQPSASANTSAQDSSSTGGGVHIGALQVTGNTFTRSPLVAGSVTYHVHGDGKR